MNRLVYTVFIFFWSSIATLLIVHALSAPPADTADTQRVFTLAEVVAHDTLEDCWMAIRGQVYDLTEYVPEHPAARSVLKPWCGIDATEGMETKGRARPHSEYAWGLLERYRIGSIKNE